MEYQFFDKYVLRTPLLTIETISSLTEKKTLDNDDLISFCNDDVVMEAIYLASPSLHSEIEKWKAGLITSFKYSNKIKFAFLRYLIRMSSRCTPFGLFSGVSFGSFGLNTDIRLSEKNKNRRRTRLDMELVISISTQLANDKVIRPHLLFYPNTSIYVAGDYLRYIEYSYEEGKRIHEISGVRNTEYIKRILEAASTGSKLTDLSNKLVDDEISLEEASEYVDKIVESQLLVCELEPSVSGLEFQENIKEIFKKIKSTEKRQIQLTKIASGLNDLDTQMGNSVEKYDQLTRLLKIFESKKELKNTFQADMSQRVISNKLDKKWLPKIRKALILLNKMTLINEEISLQEFQKGFQKRYERREIALPKVMDVEMGIGLRKNIEYGDINTFVDDLQLPKNKRENYQNQWNKLHEVLKEKLLDCLKLNKQTLLLEDSDFADFELNWDDLPDTLSGIVEICNIEGEEKLIVPGFGGASAVKLLGRFCHLNEEIHDFVNSIIIKEEQMNPDKALAEIVHLPKDRIGNVLMRPSFRKYEIPYLSNSNKQKEYQIDIDDLFISIDGRNRLKLKSKRLGKEVIPRLGNAHNFSNAQLPLYEFLGKFQSYGKRNWLGFSWGPLQTMFNYLPRVEYRGVILSKAKWMVKRKEIEPLLEFLNDEDELEKVGNMFLEKKQISQFVSLVEGDNSLLINTSNVACIQMLLNQVKSKDNFMLEEFLHMEKGPVLSNEGHFSNQFVVAMYNAKKCKKYE